MSVVSNIKSEIDKISKMDRDKKIEYYKTYYLIPSILVVIGIVLFIWFVKDTLFQKQGVCMGCAYGVELTDEQKQALTTGYLEYYGYNPEKYTAVVATDNMFEGTAQQMDANAHEMALFAQIAAGEIYYLILDKDTLELMANGGVYASLDEVLSDEYISRLSGMTVCVNDYETNEPYEAAIDLKKLGFLDGAGQEGYLVFTIARPDEDYPERLIDYLQ